MVKEDILRVSECFIFNVLIFIFFQYKTSFGVAFMSYMYIVSKSI